MTSSITVPCSMPIAGGDIAYVAEAPGETEIKRGEVLVGKSGEEFHRMLRDAGQIPSESLLTNVFNFKLTGNNVRSICASKKEMPPEYAHGPVESGAYVRPEYLYSLDRLKAELELVTPKVLVPMGNTALWAVCGVTGITKYRGYIVESTLMPGTKCIPTFHPANIMRQWGNRPFFLLDVMKAKEQSGYREIRRPDRELWLYPTVEDLYTFEKKYMQQGHLLGADIETARHKHITCMSFAPDPWHGIIVPFVDKNKANYSYWYTAEDEAAAWHWVLKWLEDKETPKLFQNGMYDTYWFRTNPLRINVMNASEDSMHLHHALQPEMLKSLHFLGSVYTSEIAWKLQRPKGTRTEKREE